MRKGIIYQKYTKEFKEESVAFVHREKLGICEAARRLNLPQQTLGNWVRKSEELGLESVKQHSTVNAAEAEICRLKRELAEARMERDILKKATAYFAKESQRGTRS